MGLGPGGSGEMSRVFSQVVRRRDQGWPRGWTSLLSLLSQRLEGRGRRPCRPDSEGRVPLVEGTVRLVLARPMTWVLFCSGQAAGCAAGPV